MQLRLSDNISIVFTEQGFSFSNWLLIEDDTRAILETGLNKGGLHGLDPNSIELVINSHYHLDHTRGNNLFKNAAIAIHNSEIAPLKSKYAYAYFNSLDEWETLMPDIDIFANHKARNFPGQLNSGDDGRIADTRKIISLSDGQIFDFGKTKVEVLHTPGHTAGHCSFLFPNEDLIFSSDICLSRAGPWYGEHLSDPCDMISSIDRIIALNPKRVVSAHRRELIENPIPVLTEFKGRISMREERIYKQLREQPSDIHELAGANLIYSHHPSVFEVFWEKLMLQKHLKRLMGKGLVRQEKNIYIGV